jgi:hypothetical protein
MEDAISKYPRVIAHISQGTGCFIKKLGNGELDIVRRLETSDFKMIYGKGPMDKITFENYICSKSAFERITCELEVCPEKEFNLWTGFQAKRIPSAGESEGLQLMKSFIMENWANNNEINYNYIISWFAGLVTNLSGINLVALAMVSPQGTGKGTLLEFMDLILRDVNTVSVSGVDKVIQKHNTILQNKRLVNINEMSSTKDEFKSNFDKLKTLITDPKITIEPKGVNPYKIKNISNYILFTNHRDAIIVEESDRRYAIFEMSIAHINDSAYFKNIRNTCFNQDVANEFYTYLLDFPAVDIIKIPDTELRREMMSMSKSTPLKFLDAVKDGYLGTLGNPNETEDDLGTLGIPNPNPNPIEVKSSVFYTSYRRWCDENGERLILTATKFGTIISTKLQKRKTNGCMVYVL